MKMNSIELALLLGGGVPIAVLSLYFVVELGRMAHRDAQLEALRRATRAAMRTDAHLHRLRRAGMRARYVGGKAPHRERGRSVWQRESERR